MMSWGNISNTFLSFQNIQEFTDQIPLIAGFASAYAEVNAEQTGEVVMEGVLAQTLGVRLAAKG